MSDRKQGVFWRSKEAHNLYWGDPLAFLELAYFKRGEGPGWCYGLLVDALGDRRVVQIEDDAATRVLLFAQAWEHYRQLGLTPAERQASSRRTLINDRPLAHILCSIYARRR